MASSTISHWALLSLLLASNCGAATHHVVVVLRFTDRNIDVIEEAANRAAGALLWVKFIRACTGIMRYIFPKSEIGGDRSIRRPEVTSNPLRSYIKLYTQVSAKGPECTSAPQRWRTSQAGGSVMA